MKMLRRMIMLGACVALADAPAPAATPPNALPQAVSAIVNQPALRHTLFGIDVYDLDSHRAVYSLNADKFFKPASTTKTLTEGTTLALLGGDFRFTTPVYRTGPIDAAGALHGDLVLVASGDPNLSQRIQPDGTLGFENEDHSYDGSGDTKAVPGDPLTVLRELAKQVAAAGIKSVTGRVYVDASLFPEGGAESGTGAYLSPIVVNDNLIDVIVTPGASPGDRASIAVSPATPYARFTNAATTGARGSDSTLSLNDTADAAGNRVVTVTGSVPLGTRPTLYAYRVPTPVRFAEVALTQALQDAGIQISTPTADGTFAPDVYAGAYVPANRVAQHVSLPLRQDVRITLKVSDNLHASLMPYLWGTYAAHAKDEQLRAGFELENALLSKAGLDLSQATQSDGLGGDAYFTPDFMVHYLAWARRQPWFADFYRGLPILGVDGTLYNIQNGAPAMGHVHAKTGTWGLDDLLNHGSMINAKGLVGYVVTRRGRHVAFALYLNRLKFRHGQDGSRAAGQILGAIANAIYVND
jgi:PBP4 family serine-type D-alanyl-D-alanine carboxypeptidase